MRVLSLVICLIAAGCGAAAEPAARATQPTAGHAAKWNVQVTLSSSSTGPITVEAVGLRRAPRSDAHPWLQHELVFRNAGNRPVTFGDTRRSTFLGTPPRLLAADRGCGYGIEHAGAPAEPGACLMYLDLLTVPPHGSATRTVTLFKDLPGMTRLVPGTYVFNRLIRFAPGTAIPDVDEGQSVTLKLRYVVSRS
jgi:hypothetical protein